MSIPADRLPLNARPWYREPWPWILMAAPLAAIIMGITMMILATRSNDGLVADDYYKRGLAMNQTLDRVERARTMGLSAAVAFNADRTQVRIHAPGLAEQTLTLRLVHPTRAGMDQVVRMERNANGMYEGAMTRPALGHWHLALEDSSGEWRISGVWSPEADGATLEPAPVR